MILPLFFVISGSAFLLKNLGFISGSTWGIVWPALLIVFGLAMLRNGKGDFFWEECCGWRRKEIKDKKP